MCLPCSDDTRNDEPKRAPVNLGKRLAVHLVSQESLVVFDLSVRHRDSV